MQGSLTRGGRENVPGIPGECATRNCTYQTGGPWSFRITLAKITCMQQSMPPVVMIYVCEMQNSSPILLWRFFLEITFLCRLHHSVYLSTKNVCLSGYSSKHFSISNLTLLFAEAHRFGVMVSTAENLFIKWFQIYRRLSVLSWNRIQDMSVTWFPLKLWHIFILLPAFVEFK